jgi:hypothetical protein
MEDLKARSLRIQPNSTTSSWTRYLAATPRSAASRSKASRAKAKTIWLEALSEAGVTLKFGGSL